MTHHDHAVRAAMSSLERSLAGWLQKNDELAISC